MKNQKKSKEKKQKRITTQLYEKYEKMSLESSPVYTEEEAMEMAIKAVNEYRALPVEERIKCKQNNS
jgi:hypothetical protein